MEKNKKEVVIREGEYVPKQKYSALPDIGKDTSEVKTVQEKKTTKKDIKKFRLCIIAVFVAVIALIVFINKDNLSFKNIGMWFKTNLAGSEVGDGFPVPIKGSYANAKNIEVYNGSLAVLSDTNFTIVTETGKEIVNFMHGYEKPVLSASQGRYIIFDLGSKNYALIQADGKVVKNSTNDAITNADITKDGSYAIITQPGDSASKIEVFTAKSEIKYSYIFANSYANAVKLDSNAKNAVVSCINSDEGMLYSNLYYFDLQKTSPIAQFTSENNLILDIAYNDNNNFYAIGEIATINYTNNTFSEFGYDGKRITAFADSNDHTAISLTNFEGSGDCTVHVFSNGIENSEFVIDQTVKAVSLYGVTVGVLTSDSVISYHLNGQKVANGEATFESKNMILSGEKKYYLLGLRDIDLREFN